MMLFWENKATRVCNFGERVERMGKARCQLHLFHVSEVGPLTFTTFSLGCCRKFCLQLCFHPPPCFLHQGQRRIILPTSLGILIFAVWMFSSNPFRNNHQKTMVQRCLMSLGSNITTGLEMLRPWAWHCMLLLIWFQAAFQYTLPLSSPSHLSCSPWPSLPDKSPAFFPWHQPCYSPCLECLSSFSYAKVRLCHHIPTQSLLQGVSQISGFHCPLLSNKEKKAIPRFALYLLWKVADAFSREADGREGQRYIVSYWNPTARWRRSWA